MRARSWIATLSGAAVVATFGVVGAGLATSARADASSTTPILVSAGNLTFSTLSSPATFTYSGAPALPAQDITTARDKCSLATSGTSFVSFDAEPAATNAKASFANASMGVLSANKKTGTACYQVNADAGESLSWQLDQSATGPLATLYGPARANSANFDINLAGNAVIMADFYNGSHRVGGAEMQSGFSAPQDLYNSYDQLFICNSTSNSGPQSGYNNNCYWHIDPIAAGAGLDPNDLSLAGYDTTQPGALTWDRVVLTAKVGQFSVQGGAQWPASLGEHRTQLFLYSLAQGTLDCTGTTPTVSNDGNVTSIRVQRLDNGVATSDGCQPIPYSLTASGGSGTFHKPATGTQVSAQFVVTFTRTIAPPSGGTTVSFPIPALKINWEDGGVTGGAATVNTLTSCPATLYQPGPAFTYGGVPADFSPMDGTQYACQFGEQQTELADGSLQVVDFVYLTGDAKFAY